MKRMTHRLDVVKISRTILTEPLYLTLFLALFMAFSVIFLSWGVYAGQWRNFKLQMVSELHGIVIDFFVTFFLVVIVNRLSERKRKIEHFKEEIDDLRFRMDIEEMPAKLHVLRRWHDTEYVRLKILKAIKALTRNHVNEIMLDHINFSGGRFEGINLRNSNISRSIGIGVLFKKANLSNTNLCSTELKESNLDHATLTGVKANNTNFSDVSMVGADCSQGTFIHARFINAELSKVNFRESNLSGASFNGAKLYNTDFRFAKGLKAEQLISAGIIYNCRFDNELDLEIKTIEADLKIRVASLLNVPILLKEELQIEG